MGLYVAYNQAMSASGAAITAGTSYTTGSKIMIQLQVPSTANILIVEYGISFDGSTAATPAVVELVKAGTATTMANAHSTTTVQNIGRDTLASRLTMATTGTGYGATTMAGTSTVQTYDKQYVAPTNQYVKQWPLGREPFVAPSSIVQLRVNTSATVNALSYIVWEEM